MDLIFNSQIFNDLFFNFQQIYCRYKSIYLTLHRKHLYMEQLLAQNVKRICKERKLQMKDLAIRMGVDPSALNRALKGNARFNTIEKIANALDVSIKSLFEQTDDVEGFIRIGGKVYQFNSQRELKKILINNCQKLGV